MRSNAPPATLPFDPATAIRNALASSKSRVEGKRELNGKPVIAIQLSSLVNDSAGWGDGPGETGRATVLVNPRSYTPVQIEFRNVTGASVLLGTPYFGGSLTLIERFTAFERLSSTTANLRLTSLSAHHPTAKCRLKGLSRPCGNPPGTPQARTPSHFAGKTTRLRGDPRSDAGVPSLN